VTSKNPAIRSRERKETTMTISQPADTAAAPPDTATAKAGTPRRRLIVLASVVLAVLAGVAAAVAILIPPAAPTAHGTIRPHSTETDTITGGTGRYAGATGTYTNTISAVVVSATSTSQTSRVTAAARGHIRY
jgi:hypothetical protein